MHDNAGHNVRIRQIVPSRTEALHQIREQVEAEARSFGFDDDTAFRLALAVDEACTNIIKHSYSGDPTCSFDFEILTADDSFVIVLTDQGKGFTPSASLSVDMQHYIDQRRVGGLGLHIINLVMDDISYATTANHLNRLQMIKYRNA